MLSAKQLAKFFDHTLLSPTASTQEITQLCNEAKEYQFFSVCVHPSKLNLCKELLEDSGVELCTVVGFPLGQNSSASKAFETRDAIQRGATEIDMVMNVAELKEGNDHYVVEDIKAVNEASGTNLVKVIINSPSH